MSFKTSFSGYHFVYNGVDSSKYGLKFIHPDTDPYLGGSIESATFGINNGTRFFMQSSERKNPLIMEVKMFTEMPLSQGDVSEIYNNFFNHNDYKKLYTKNPEYEGLFYNCILKNITAIMGGTQTNQSSGYSSGICGFSLTIECDSPFMWSDEIVKHFDSTDDALTLNNKSHNKDYLYPKLTFKVGLEGGDVTIQNTTDNNRLSIFKNLEANETIVLDNEKKIITSTFGLKRYSDFNKLFFRLLQGQNSIHIIGDVEWVEIKYKEQRVI